MQNTTGSLTRKAFLTAVVGLAAPACASNFNNPDPAGSGPAPEVPSGDGRAFAAPDIITQVDLQSLVAIAALPQWAARRLWERLKDGARVEPGPLSVYADLMAEPQDPLGLSEPTTYDDGSIHIAPAADVAELLAYATARGGRSRYAA